MKATDLMIGDYVNTSEGIVKTVTSRDFEDNDFERYYPIPLTPEILEKNGFGFGGGYIYKLDDSQMVIEYSYGFLFGWVFCHKKQLNYVHELQHVLYLCGIEKEIIL